MNLQTDTRQEVHSPSGAQEITAEQVRLLVENLPTLCWIATPDGYIFWYNARWHEYCGTTPAEMEGWGWKSVHDPKILPDVLERWQRCISAGAPFEMTFPLKRADAIFRPFLTRILPLKDREGTVLWWVGTNTDVTAQVEAETALRVSEAQLKDLNASLLSEQTRERNRLWESSPDLLVVLDLTGIIKRVNPAWTTILGYPSEELVGRKVNFFLMPEDVAQTQHALKTAASGPFPPLENRYRHKDGSVRWLSWVASPSGGEIYATGRHVTAEKQAKMELARTEEALRQSQKMEAVGQLTGGLAHDFNNLLTSMMGSMELARARMAQGRLSEVDRYMEVAQSAGRRAASLTQRLLAFSRRQTLDPKPTEVNGLITGMEELIRRTIGPAIVLEVVGAVGLWPTLIDPSQLENALLNLCLNARDAMPDGGRVTIETANRWLDGHAASEREIPAGQYISVCVTDTGTGMTRDVIARAFDPFFTTKPLGEGTGLGLSMIYGFARQSGGQVRIYSEINRGTTVCLYLPRNHAQPQDPSGDPGIETAEVRGSGEVVLVVDDEPSIRMLIFEVLGEAGYTGIEVGDGPAALKILQSNAKIDLLITDVGLPGGLNGRQVCDAGRALRPRLKVLFITGYAENAVVGNGHLEPQMHLLTKPFTMDTLARRIREILES